MNVTSYLLAHLLSSSPWHVSLCSAPGLHHRDALLVLSRPGGTHRFSRPSPCFSPAELRRAHLPPCQSLILIKLVTALMQVTNKAVQTMRYKSSRLIAGDLGNLRASFLFRARRHSPVLIPSCSGWKNPLPSTLLNASLCLAHASGFSEHCETFLHTVMMKCCKALKQSASNYIKYEI